MPLITRDYHRQIIDTIKDLSSYNKWWSAPINLGGSGGTDGGSGIPIGGMHGQLIQTKVAYDTTEAAYSGIRTNVPSGSLVDNLAHIRLDLQTVSGASPLAVQENDVTITSQTNTLNFEGGVTVLDEGAGKATVTISGIGPGGSGIHHGTLSGLADDDHPQYLLHKNQIKVHDSGGITITSATHTDPGANGFSIFHNVTFEGNADFAGEIEHASPTGAPAEFLDGIQTEFRDNNVTNPPTDSELNTAFGTTHREGFIGILDDDGGDNNVYLVVSSAGNYYYLELTKAV
jgi:hypothetical protein